MRTVSCLVCGSSDALPVYRLRRDHYLRRLGLEREPVVKVMCAVCSLVYTQPQLERPELDRLYEGLHAEDAPSEEHLWWKRRQAKEDFDWVDPHVPEKGRVLDIGCAEGSFLLHFRERGWSTVGIEPSSFAVYGRQAYGLDIRHGSFDAVDLPAGAFDLVTALRVLEHVEGPREDLVRIRTLLKPGGLLYLEVPDVWKPRHDPREFLGAQHLRLFTAGSLRALLRRAGFTPIQVDDGGRGLRAVARPGDPDPALTFPSFDGPRTARRLRHRILRYRIAHFTRTRVRVALRRGLGRILGTERASSFVSVGKTVLRLRT
jgi:SAM-dependent methyltransferase